MRAWPTPGIPVKKVSYWREEPLEVDGIIEGSWGAWAVEIKSGRVTSADLRGLLEFTRRFPAFRPLLVCNPESRIAALRTGIFAIPWQEFLRIPDHSRH